MKNYISICMCITAFALVNAQYSTGTVILSENLNYSASFETSEDLVTLTLKAPDGFWMGLGFGISCMTEDGDVVIYDGTTLSDRKFLGVGIPPVVDDNQDWIIVSNTEDNGVRTVIANRLLDTNHDGDYVFSNAADPITLVWALGFSNTLSSHSGRQGSTMSSFVLDTPKFVSSQFKMFPNPATNSFELLLPKQINSGEIAISDVTSKVIKRFQISQLATAIDISDLRRGVYLITVDTGAGGTITKKLSKI